MISVSPESLRTGVLLLTLAVALVTLDHVRGLVRAPISSCEARLSQFVVAPFEAKGGYAEVDEAFVNFDARTE